MNYYNDIKNKLIDNEIYSKIKDYSKERYRVITYFEIGKLLNDAGSVYGENVIGKYAEKLMIEVGKKYNKRTLFRMRQFYIVFSDEKVSPLGTQLSWSHCRTLLSMKDYSKINYYINLTINQNLSKRELEWKIKNKEYERLPEETKVKLITKEKVKVADLIKNPILIKNSDNRNEDISEKTLQGLILENIESFMNELGSSFREIIICKQDNKYVIKYCFDDRIISRTYELI